ncbi:hypothetical protein SAMN05216455_102191 [Segatella bryantii]|jgi:hypothetical protein|uniref:hypothetical protein n=1 Tax=Segatella bryantii TaxID=77095 RepID=UPI00089CE85E|nr:hypothetical protein [Segatella bryantii]SDZ99479.1 hypothetical protein SAMN05216455_102191 [Segatella bryantii]
MLLEVLVYLLDILIREPKLIIKYYREKSKEGREENGRMIFMADGRFPHGGMFDRLKGAISIYAASKVLHKPFKICFCSPFRLDKYLEPNLYDWRIEPTDICYHYPDSRPLFLYGEYANPRRLLKRRNCDAHFYYGYNSLDYINKKCHLNFDWGQLYHELFKPTPYLQKYLDAYKEDIGQQYIVIHFRFLNLLGDQVEYAINPTLEETKQRKLKEQALIQFRHVREQHSDCRVMLATDSNHFTQFVKHHLPDTYVIPGDIKHIGTTSQTKESDNLKMFLDYYLIAGARKVYNIVGPGMWPSAFPEYAAKIGKCPFERIYFTVS